MTYQAYGMPPGGMPTGRATFRFGDVFSRGFNVFFRHVLLFSAIGAVFLAPGVYFQMQLVELAELVKQNPTPETTFLSAEYWTALGGGLLVPIIGQVLAQLLINILAFQTMRGRPASVPDALLRVLGRLLPLIGTWFIVTIVVMIGMILLVVPGIIIGLMATVAIPVCLLERKGPIGSFERSRDLTRGSRWLILATYLVLGVVGGITSVIIQQAGNLIVGPTIAVFINFPFTAAYTAFGAVLTISIYQELLLVKEGPDSDRFASVFD